ncbi:MAG: VWA domain-containing protein [Deltaproteobacteria bacterium]|nr:MAG: VWA domain-containing protein [Deltaproteobacteria bacterium]
MTIRFEDPWVLLAIPLVLAGMILYDRKRRGGTARLRFSNIAPLKDLPPSPALLYRKVLLFLRIVAMLLLLLAMARPQAGRKGTEVMTEGIDIFLVLDTSGSMQALDFDPNLRDRNDVNRLEVVKKVVKDFIKGRSSDRIGMIVFGEEAFTQCPLTLDHGILLSFLDLVEINMAGNATAIGNALATGVRRLKDSPSKSKVIILLTDGRNNAGHISPLQAADLAKTFGIKTYTIGAGTEGKAPFRARGLFGPSLVYQPVDLDADVLRKIAERTGGKFFRATDPKTLRAVYEEIDRLEKTETKVKEYLEYSEVFGRFAIPGLLLLLLEIVLANTRFRKIP